MQSSDLTSIAPDLARVAPRIHLADLPTPVQPLDEARGLWVKRDDLTSAAYGGNKVRKLEYLLARAKRCRAGRLVTIGALGSHHALATTVHGRALGFQVSLALLPQPMTPHVQEVLQAAAAHGAQIQITRSAATIPLAVANIRLRHWRENVHVIPAGGSDAFGTLGYVAAGLELAAQHAAGECPHFDEIHVAGGTLGTAAGLAVGLAIAGMQTHVVAHRITVRAITNERTARRLTRGALRILKRGGASALPTHRESLSRLRIVHDQIGDGYGHATSAGMAAAEWFAQRGLVLDATYTAKAAAGVLAAAGSDDRKRLYWHTLGPLDSGTGAA